MTPPIPQSPVASPFCPPCPSPSRLDAYYDHELPESERSATEAHLAACAACREALEQIASASSLVKSIELPALSPMSRARLMRDLTDPAAAAGRDRWIISIRLLTTAAAAVFILATCLIVYQLRHSTPGNTGRENIQQIVAPHTPGSSIVVPAGATHPAAP